MAGKTIIVSVTNDLATDNRVKKVCDFLHQHDFTVTLVGRVLPNSLDVTDRPYKVKRFKLWFNKGALFYANYNLRLFWFLLFHKSDYLLANDLDTLLANGLIKKWRAKTKLIYDSHEYFTEVPELINRPKVKKIWERIEKKYIKQVDQMYTVNESIAHLYANKYQREIRVVRNIGNYKGITQTKNRRDLNLPDDKFIVLFQGAGINIDRGGEELVDAIKSLDNVLLIFAGDGDVIPLLKKKVDQENLQDKVKFISKLPYAELLQYTFNADLGVSLDKDTNINYKYSLPNKLFDYIHCQIPVLVSNLTEIEKIVSSFQVGLITVVEPKSIAEKISELMSSPEKYHQLKSNTKKASQELNWENEEKVLEKIYL